jgi:type II restriction enzyme
VPTSKQSLGKRGERVVIKSQKCPRCKRKRTLKALPVNFKCADIICDFCGYLAQVKSFTARNTDPLPNHIPGAAWGPQRVRMESGIFYPLFLVAVPPSGKNYGLWYLPADLQTPEMFTARKPLSNKAKRRGWQGVAIDLRRATCKPIRLNLA